MLSNQEIRNCIFSGPFNDQLKTLNKNPNWQHINQLNDHKNKRLKYVELILRFFSFYDDKEEYGGTLSQFLNSFMKKHRKPDDRFLREKEQIFERTVDVIRSKIFTEEAEHIGVSTLEALMFGIAKNIDSAESIDDHLLKEKFQKLKRHQSLSKNYLSGGTTKKDKVDARLEAGRTIFSCNND